MSFGAFLDGQSAPQSVPQQSSAAGGFGDFLDGKQPAAAPAAVTPAAQPAANPGGVLGFLQKINSYFAPTDMQQATGPDGNASGLEIAGNAAGNFLKGAVRDTAGLVGTGVLGAAGAADKAYNAVTGTPTPTEGFLGQANQVASNIIPGLEDWGKGELQGAGNLINPATRQNQVYTLADNTFKDPFSALLNAAMAGEGVGAGVKAAGDALDNGAVKSALEGTGAIPGTITKDAILAGAPAAPQSGLMGFLQSIGQRANLPTDLASLGSQISSGANKLNPFVMAKNAYGSATGAAGNTVSALVGGDDQTAAGLSGLASGDSTALKQVLPGNMGVNEAKTMMQEALSGIDQRTAQEYGMPQMDLSSLRDQAVQIAKDHGINPVVLNPGELSTVEQYLGEVKKMGTTESDPHKLIELGQQAQGIAEKYGLAQPVEDTSVFGRIENAIRSPRRIGRQTIPYFNDLKNALSDVYQKNGLVSINQGLSSLPQASQAALSEGLDKLFRLGGTADPTGDWAANAQKVQTLKNLFGNLYDDSGNLSRADRESNRIITNLKNATDSNLRDYPGWNGGASYDQANKAYQQAYGVAGLKGVVTNDFKKAFSHGVNVPGILRAIGATAVVPAAATAATGAGLTVAPALKLLSAATSPTDILSVIGSLSSKRVGK